MGEWLRWYYLIYLLPAGLAVLLLLLAGLGPVGDADGADAAPADADVDLDVEGPAAEAGEAGDADGDGVGGVRGALAFLGVGRAPLTLVCASLMIGWGLWGIVATEVLKPLLKAPAAFALPAMVAAAAG